MALNYNVMNSVNSVPPTTMGNLGGRSVQYQRPMDARQKALADMQYQQQVLSQQRWNQAGNEQERTRQLDLNKKEFGWNQLLQKFAGAVPHSGWGTGIGPEGSASSLGWLNSWLSANQGVFQPAISAQAAADWNTVMPSSTQTISEQANQRRGNAAQLQNFQNLMTQRQIMGPSTPSMKRGGY